MLLAVLSLFQPSCEFQVLLLSTPTLVSFIRQFEVVVYFLLFSLQPSCGVEALVVRWSYELQVSFTRLTCELEASFNRPTYELQASFTRLPYELRSSFTLLTYELQSSSTQPSSKLEV